MMVSYGRSVAPSGGGVAQGSGLGRWCCLAMALERLNGH